MKAGITLSVIVMFAGILISRGQDGAGWCDPVLSHSKYACTLREFPFPLITSGPLSAVIRSLPLTTGQQNPDGIYYPITRAGWGIIFRFLLLFQDTLIPCMSGS